MKATAAMESRFLERQFFDRAGTFWEQFERSLRSDRENGPGLLSRVSSGDAYTFFLATADRIFAQDATLAFLDRLRIWAKDRVGARHASTPQIHIYIDGCRRELAQDATPSRWHYLYSLTRSDAPLVGLLRESGLQRRWLGFTFGRIANFQLRFNEILVHETSEAYAIDAPKFRAAPIEGGILLHGYLW